MKLTAPDPSVRARVVWEAVAIPETMHWDRRLVVEHAGTPHDIIKVFDDAFEFWRGLYEDLGIIEGRFISADDD